MPYLARIHEQQDPEFKDQRDRVKLFIAFYTASIKKAFPAKTRRWANGVSDKEVFFFQDQLAAYKIFPGLSLACFNEDRQAPAHPPARE